MSLEMLNFQLFGLINASANPNPFLVKFAIFISHDLVTIFVIGLLALTFFRPKRFKIPAIKAAVFTAITSIIAALIDKFYYHPRPFALNLGHKLIHHAATNSFPSHHMLAMSSMALAFLLFSREKLVGSICIALAWLVGWSRVYLGVHFPVDIIGAFLLALFINILGNLVLCKYLEFRKSQQKPSAHI
ncbi:undecaprenyl-diphosphatase [Acinetobacter sp. ANC 3791]|nr:undecaprenyl-diphosphatase [Acinetobacter sp. ANC 3791]